MKSNKIIISGPPSSGKTTIINALKKRGYVCFNEISPIDIDLSINTNKLILSKFLFSKRKEQYKALNNQLSFYDRSLIDVIAYMNFWNEKYPSSWDKEIHNCEYFHKVFYTSTWKAIYKQTTNRQETYQEAQKIDLFLRKAYLNFKYQIIEVPHYNISKRVDFIINNI